MKKFFISILLVIISLFILDRGIGMILQKMSERAQDSKIQEARNNEADVAIIGASVAYNQYDAKLMSDSLGVKVFNYGIGGMNIYSHYFITHLLLEVASKQPRFIIYQPCFIDLEDKPGWNTEKLDYHYGLYQQDSVATQIVDLQGWEKTLLLRGILCYRHNGQLFYYLKNFNSDHKNETLYLHNGFSPLRQTYSKEIADAEESHPLDKQKVSYLYRLIDLCERHNVILVIANAPTYQIYHDQQWLTLIDKVSKERNIPYLNYCQDSTFLSHPEWFYNPAHLNEEGSKLWTKKLIGELRELFDFNE